MNPKPTQKTTIKPIEPKFQRRTENFVCENCGTFVKGDGYTNHCPNCLYFKHVDINPGDRAEKCGGIMKPVGILKRGSELYVLHKCQKCNFQRKNSTNPKDNFQEIIKISKLH